MNTWTFEHIAKTLQEVVPEIPDGQPEFKEDGTPTTFSNEMMFAWQNSEIPKRHSVRPQSQNAEWTKRKDQVLGYLGKGSIIVLTGKRGTGKTQLGVEAIRSNSYKALPSRYCQAMDVFLCLREAMTMKDKSERQALEPYLRPHLLVIDALEERGESQWEDRMLNHLIDKRYGALKDTILITNQNREAFAQSMGPSIVSRVHETGEVIECVWESFRERKQ